MVVPGSIPKMIFSNANRVDLTILAKIAKMNATILHMFDSIRKYSSSLNTILKYIVSFAALFYVGYRLINTPFTLQDLSKILTLSTFLVVFLLTACNWCFEILKWQVVVNTFSKVSFKKATYQTFVAYTYGMLTPFNTGNYAKKIFFFPKKHSKRIVFLNLAKGMYQMLVTVIFGSWGVHLLIDKIDTKAFNQKHFLIITAIIGLAVGLFFRKKIQNLIQSISLKTHLLLFTYSVVKFICFSLILVFLLYKQELNCTELYAGICAIYLLSSLLPILNILDFAIKGSVALWVLVPIGYSESQILIAYFILWICNYAGPAILGSTLQLYATKKTNL